MVSSCEIFKHFVEEDACELKLKEAVLNLNVQCFLVSDVSPIRQPLTAGYCHRSPCHMWKSPIWYIRSNEKKENHWFTGQARFKYEEIKAEMDPR